MEEEMIFFLLLFLSYAHGAEINFEDLSIDNWKLLIGANEKELHYDFCKYNATSSGTQCTSFPKVASINISEVCNCSVKHTETEVGSINFSVICNSNSSWCPENLDLKYHQGSFEKPSEAEEISATAISLVLSLVCNACFIIKEAFVTCRDRVHSYCML